MLLLIQSFNCEERHGKKNLEMHHVDMKGKRIEEAREMVEVRNTKYFHNGSFVWGRGVLGIPRVGFNWKIHLPFKKVLSNIKRTTLECFT